MTIRAIGKGSYDQCKSSCTSAGGFLLGVKSAEDNAV
jgi:hypothetical protein